MQVYCINAQLWLDELGCTLGEIPPSALDRFAHFDAVWLLGVWERSPRAAAIARELFRDHEQVGASPYAVRSFTVEPAFGGVEGLQSVREAFRSRGLRLLLDFIPNHVAPDHPWTAEHPEYFVRDGDGFAHGRDPYFPPWTDTVQLDYRRGDVREAMTRELLRISELCDGVRCDMAMLVLRDVFCRTWGGAFDRDEQFWPAAIEAVRRRHRDFVFLAEVYWGRDAELRAMGFDFTYDKTLYDRLREDNASAVREHLRTPQEQLAHFVENHDEERAAHAFARPERNRAAATIALTLPGLRLVHDGQVEGRKTRIPVQLQRRPFEEPDRELQQFYARLLPELHALRGEWRLLEPRQAWASNESHRNFVAYTWTDGEQRRVVAVNGSGERSQCYLRLGAGPEWTVRDVLHDLEYRRSGDELYLDVPAYFAHVFVLR